MTPRTTPPDPVAANARPRARRTRRAAARWSASSSASSLGLALAAGVAWYLMRVRQSLPASTAQDAARRRPRASRAKAAKAEPAARRQAALRLLQDPARRRGAEAAVEAEKSATGALERAKDRPRTAGRAATKAPDKARRAASARQGRRAGAAGAKPGSGSGCRRARSPARPTPRTSRRGSRSPAGKRRCSRPTLPDKGLRYRVRLGPYDNTDELNRIKAELGKRGFDVAVIKSLSAAPVAPAGRRPGTRVGRAGPTNVTGITDPRAFATPTRGVRSMPSIARALPLPPRLRGGAAVAALPLAGAGRRGCRKGSNYVRLKNPQPVETRQEDRGASSSSRYGCPHCADLDPVLQAWQKTLPADVAFRRVPVMFQEPLGRARQGLLHARGARRRATAARRRSSSRSTEAA